MFGRYFRKCSRVSLAFKILPSPSGFKVFRSGLITIMLQNFLCPHIFCAFLWQLYGSSEARPAFLRRAVHPKQCMNVEGKLFAKRPKGMLASGTSFRPPCFLKLFPILKIVILNIKMHVCVGRSNFKREIHFSNPLLSLCLRM